jgi:signal peptidase I
VGIVGDYQTWRNRQRAIKEARLLLREARRVVRKYAVKLGEQTTAKVRGDIDALSAAVIGRDWDKLPGALNTLDETLDQHLGFARKSTTREYAESIGVAVLIALFLRAFVVEAFKIPSGSMIPTLQVGDHIFVNKFIYGVRIPFTNIKFGMNYRKPERGEVIVFIFPKDPDKDFIKRIVGIEGDTIEMRDDQIFVNGTPIAREQIPGPCDYMDFREETARWMEGECTAWRETVPGNSYTTIHDKIGAPHSWPEQGERREEQRGWQKVPPGHVFVMGDNRDNSHDSRYWGFVPFENIKGKAMVIWFSMGPASPNDSPFLRFFKSLRYDRLFHLVR